MRIYLTDLAMPELSMVPPALRQQIVRRALKTMRSHTRFFFWLPTFFGIGGGLIGWLLGAALATYFRQAQMADKIHFAVQSIVWSYAGLSGGFCAAGFIGLQLRRCKLRPYLRDAIQNYGCDNTQSAQPQDRLQ